MDINTINNDKNVIVVSFTSHFGYNTDKKVTKYRFLNKIGLRVFEPINNCRTC